MSDFKKLRIFSQLTNRPLNTLYRQVSTNPDSIPGLVRFSPRDIRVHWPTFMKAMGCVETEAVETAKKSSEVAA
jgi:hypothetical protein